jgi:TRAP-type C4-dicarboxylate transport system permease small subunit
VNAARHALGAINAATRMLLGVCVAATVTLVATQVFTRYVVGLSFAWVDEIARYLLVWIGFLGSVVAARTGAHICIETLVNALPRRVGRIVTATMLAILVVFLLVLVCESWILTERVQLQRSGAMRISVAWVYAAAPVGFALMAVNFAAQLAAVVREILRGPSDAQAEGVSTS